MYSRVGQVDKSQTYVWDSTTLTWVASPAPGGSGVSSTQVNISSVTGRVAVAPNDTNFASSAGFHFDSSGALQINVVQGSAAGDTSVTVTPAAGSTFRVQPGSTLWASSAGFHFDSSGALNIAGTFSASTTVNVSSLAGIVTAAPVSSSGASLSTDAAPASTSYGMTVRQVGFVAASTTAQVSSVAGRVTVAPSDTNWASSAGFHFDSSGALNIAGTFSASTTAQVSSVAGRVTTAPNDTSWASSAGFHFDSSGALNVAASFSGSTTVNVSSLAVSTGFVKQAGFSVNSSNELAITGSFSASTTVNVSSLAGVVTCAPVSSSGASLSTDAAPASTSYGMTVRQVGFVAFSTTAQVSSVAGRVTTAPSDTNWASSAGFHFDSSGAMQITGSFSASTTVNVSSLAGVVTAALISSSGASLSTDAAPASTSYGITVRQVGFVAASTTVNVSSLAGAVIVRSSAADALGTVYQSSFGALCVTAHNSTIGDLLASVQQNSTVWQTQAKIQDSSGVGPNIVGTRPSTGAQGFAVRTVLNDLQSTCFSTMGNNSTSSTIVSSAATRVKVFAYSITSTAQAINTLSFASSLGNPIWQMQMQAMTSGITGANLAVTPPAWLFATAANEPLVFKISPNTGSYHLSFSYFTEA